MQCGGRSSFTPVFIVIGTNEESCILLFKCGKIQEIHRDENKDFLFC